MAKPIRRHNRGYSGGFPLAVGDRMYAQDLFRDSAYYEAITGIAYNDLTRRTAPYILNGLVCVQGAGHTMTVSAGKAVVPFQVTIPDTGAAWALPPTTANADIDMVLDYAGGVDLSLAGATADGATPNYVKLLYAETNGNTRSRAKKAGSYNYEVYDSVTVTIDAVAPTAYEVNTCTFTTDGATVTITDYGDSRVAANMQKHGAVVYSQATFNEIMVRTAANTYEIRDDITSVYFKYLSGGYLCYGGTSFLSGGDTYAHITTNNCADIIFEEGAYLHMGNTEGYLETNTTGCYLLNVDIRGLGTVASAILYSFYNTATYVTYENCKSSTRLSNAAGGIIVFRASAGALVKESSKYTNCSVSDMANSGGAAYGFGNIHNLINCFATNISSSSGIAGGFGTCNYVNNSRAVQIFSSSTHAWGISACNYVSNCETNQIDHNGAVAGQNAYGFYSCAYLSDCSASDVDTNGAGGNADGYNTCDNVVSSYATTCNNGFNTCNGVSGCLSSTNSLVGYASCNMVSSSKALSNTGNGFGSCNELSACQAISNGSNGFANVYRASVCLSQSNTSWGFNTCRQLHSNRATANTAGQYTASFADFGGANATADTAAGGYNG